jgi:hypothetical protein
MFGGLAGGMRATIAEMLRKIGIAPSPEAVTMVHALGSGPAIPGLALGEKVDRPNTAATLRQLFRLIAASHPSSAEDSGGSS